MYVYPNKYVRDVFEDDNFTTFDERNYRLVTSADFYKAGFDDVMSKVEDSLDDIRDIKDDYRMSYRKQGLFSKAYFELCKLLKAGRESKGNPKKEKKFIKQTQNYYLDEFQKEEWKLYEKDYELVPYFNDANHQLDQQIQEESCQAVIDMVANNTSMTDAEFNSQPSQSQRYRSWTDDLPKERDIAKYALAGLAIYFLFNSMRGSE